MSAAPVRDPHEGLEQLASLASEVEAPALARSARQLAERAAQGMFYVACIGQFKRGKSTLLNALIGEEILPTGVIPVTALVTVIRHGSRQRARAHFLDGRAQDIEPTSLLAYVSEDGNPHNEKAVAWVELFVPSAMLASGMCLVDTPGLGSVFLASNERTRAFVPPIDAALVVLGADPPISGEELALVRELGGHVRDFVFVLNKSDRLSAEELAAARAFSQRVLADAFGRPTESLCEISALDRLRGTGSERDWPALVGALHSLASRSGAELARGAVQRNLERITGQIRHDIQQRRRALLEPLEASERRLVELHEFVAQAEQSLGDLGYLLQGEQDRIARELAEHRARFLAKTRSEAHRRLQQQLRGLPSTSRLRPYTRSVAPAAGIARFMIDAWRSEVEPLLEALYQKVTARFVGLANQFLERLASSAAPGSETLPQEVFIKTGLSSVVRFRFEALEWLARPSPGESLLYLVSPGSARRRRLEAAMGRYLDELFEVTSTRVLNDFSSRVLESRRQLEAELRSQIAELQRSAERALDRAQRVRAKGGHAIEGELQRLARLDAELTRITGSAPEEA
jgi:hypothetical protein